MLLVVCNWWVEPVGPQDERNPDIKSQVYRCCYCSPLCILALSPSLSLSQHSFVSVLTCVSCIRFAGGVQVVDQHMHVVFMSGGTAFSITQPAFPSNNEIKLEALTHDKNKQKKNVRKKTLSESKRLLRPNLDNNKKVRLRDK